MKKLIALSILATTLVAGAAFAAPGYPHLRDYSPPPMYPEGIMDVGALTTVSYTFTTKQDIKLLRAKISHATEKSNGDFSFVAGTGGEAIGQIVAFMSGTVYTYVLGNNDTQVTVTVVPAPAFSKASMIKSHVAA